MTVSYATTNFGGAYFKIYVCFEQKNPAFVMQNFRNFVGVRVNIFDETPKRHIFANFMLFEPLCVQTGHGFFSRRADEKRGHCKKSQRGYISPICGEFPIQPNLTKIGI